MATRDHPPQYRDPEAGKLRITSDLYERIVELCGWPRWRGSSANQIRFCPIVAQVRRRGTA